VTIVDFLVGIVVVVGLFGTFTCGRVELKTFNVDSFKEVQ